MAEGGQVKVEIIDNNQGIARTQSPTNKNYAFELPTFGAIVGVSQTEVQWDGLILKEPLSRSPKSSLVNMEFQCKLCSSKKYEIQKVLSLAILRGLPTALQVTHWRYPTTDPHRDSWLVGFPSSLFRLALDNLILHGSPERSMQFKGSI